jgi:hypothetical protein
MFHRQKGILSIQSIFGILLGTVFFVALLPTIAVQIYAITNGNNSSLYSTAGLTVLGLVVLVVIAIFVISIVKEV